MGTDPTTCIPPNNASSFPLIENTRCKKINSGRVSVHFWVVRPSRMPPSYFNTHRFSDLILFINETLFIEQTLSQS